MSSERAEIIMLNKKMDRKVVQNKTEITIESTKPRVILEEKVLDGDSMASQEDMVSSKELKHLEETTNLKLDKMNSEIEGKFNTLNATVEGKFNSVDNKIDNLEKSIENMFLKNKNETLERERKDAQDTRRWIVGTGIAIIGLVFTFIKFFV